TSWTDYSVQARVKVTAFNGTDRFAAVLARVQGSTSYYYLTLRSSNRIELKRLVSGSSTVLDSAPLSVTTGTYYTLKLEVAGTTLRGSVNGVLLTEATDTRWTAGRIGVATFNASANFDDVLLASAGGPTPPPPGRRRRARARDGRRTRWGGGRRATGGGRRVRAAERAGRPRPSPRRR